jgi:isochorismate synthase EntC
MINFIKIMYSPGGENESSNSASNNKDDQGKDSKGAPEKKEEEHKTVVQKIKDALKDWSNKDEADQEFDDTKV